MNEFFSTLGIMILLFFPMIAIWLFMLLDWAFETDKNSKKVKHRRAWIFGKLDNQRGNIIPFFKAWFGWIGLWVDIVIIVTSFNFIFSNQGNVIFGYLVLILAILIPVILMIRLVNILKRIRKQKIINFYNQLKG